MTGNVRDTTIVARQVVLDLVDGIVLAVDGTNQHVVGDVVQVAAELQPRSSSTDVICGAFALHLQKQKKLELFHPQHKLLQECLNTNYQHGQPFDGPDLDEDLQVLQIIPTPLVKGLQQLETVALWADVHLEATTISRRVLVGVLARVKVLER